MSGVEDLISWTDRIDEETRTMEQKTYWKQSGRCNCWNVLVCYKLAVIVEEKILVSMLQCQIFNSCFIFAYLLN